MKAELTREQLTMIVERARYQRSLAAGNLHAAATRKCLGWMAKAIDKFLHLLLMSPTAPR